MKKEITPEEINENAAEPTLDKEPEIDPEDWKGLLNFMAEVERRLME